MSIEIVKNKILAPLTTLQVGGSAAYFVEVQNEKQLLEAVVFAQDQQLAITVLGGGSNVLVDEAGLEGLVIAIRILGRSFVNEGNDVLLTVGAGEELDAIVEYTVTAGWWGIENLSHIPGLVGATPVQNVGAYGVEVKDAIATVRALNTETHKFELLTPEECQFGYRDSFFKKEEGKKYIITEVTYRLSLDAQPHTTYRDLANYFKEKQPSLTEVRDAVIEIRSKKFPDWHRVGTAGSFFKNPIITEEKFSLLKVTYPNMPGYNLGDGTVKVALGWVLDSILGLKGVRDGNVGTYEGQALVLVNDGNATAPEIQKFAEKIVRQVKEKIGLDIEWEVTKLS